MGKITQGDIVLVDFNPTRGHEQKGVRPAVVVSSPDFTLSGMVIVCPVTSVIKERAGFVIIKKAKSNGLDLDSEILTSQIRTVSLERVVKRIGSIDTKIVTEVFENLDLLLGR
jgi:mRNA interferase MazF